MCHDAIIFDIDGTLWNASPASAAGWTAGLTKLGIDITISSKQIENVAGNPYEKCVEMLLPGFMGKYPDLVRVLNDHETEAVTARGGDFYDGVIQGVKELAGRYRLFLVSNCQQWYLDLFLGFSGFRPVLTGFDCHGMSGVNKSEMLSRLKIKYSLDSPVYIGDTSGDETAARQARMEFIYAAWGFGRPKQGVKTANSFTELLDYFRR